MTGTAEPSLVHECLLYSNARHLAEQAGERLSESLAAGEQVVAVVDDQCRAALTEFLDGRTAGRTPGIAVTYLDPLAAQQLPAFTLAREWAGIVRCKLPEGRRTTLLAQHLDLPATDPGRWLRLEAALNVAFDGLPATMLCGCPIGTDLGLAGTTHSTLRLGGRTVPSNGLRDPAEIVAQYPPPPPPDLGPPATEVTFVLADLPLLRSLVGAFAAEAGAGPDRTADLVLAVDEITTNSVEHGPGTGQLRLWRLPDRVVAEVSDSGRMTVPFPGITAPPPAAKRGRGLWLASELTDVLQVWSKPEQPGTVVRLHLKL